MTHVEQLAAFVVRTSFEDLSVEARHQLKIRVLDALGCALGTLEGPPIKMLHAQLEDFGGKPLVSLIGNGKTAPDRAALYNSALVRYLDYNDSYIARKETCHPSDNLGAVLAASEYAHSLPYMVAVALLDVDVSPAQYLPERIVREDVQSLLRRVTIHPDEALSKRFPAEMPCRITITLKDGRTLAIEKNDYEGFATRPMSWEKAAAKFELLAAPFTEATRRDAIVETVAHLETKDVAQLTELLRAANALIR